MIVDPVTLERTLLGVARDDRPNEFRNGADARCAFCPGNEEFTPPEIARTEGASGWITRVFPNKYPAVDAPGSVHEVIVDSPDHTTEFTRQGWSMWRKRYISARLDNPRAVPVLFKNRGEYAGATMVHPHTQMIVLDSLPERWFRMRSAAGCPWCSEAAKARELGTIVAENEHASAFVRTSSRFSWAVTVLARECSPAFDWADAEAWQSVGALLENLVVALLRGWSADASFNIVVPSDPLALPRAFHWHAELIPRMATLAGFELATGMFIRSASAEESAARWRQLIALPHGSV